MIVNFTFLNSKNGMFYYAQDYIESTKCCAVEVVGDCNLRTDFYTKVKNSCIIYYNAIFKSSFIYTPTIHPMPFINNQLVVCHDSYPFKGFKGRIKRTLLNLALKTSSCKVAYINRGDSKSFVDSLSLEESRKVFLPNLIKPSDMNSVRNKPAQTEGFINIALIGTDSDKKRYEVLFESVLKCEKEIKSRVKFHLFGGYTQYCDYLIKKYNAKLNLSWCNPKDQELSEFLRASNVLISIARGEGFGRPISFSLQLGLPTMLIDDPTFVEFFGQVAYIYSSEESLVDSIIDVVSTHEAKPYPDKLFILELNQAKSRFIALCQ